MGIIRKTRKYPAVMKRLRHFVASVLEDLRNVSYPLWLKATSWVYPFLKRTKVPVVVTMTSYPARIESAWIAIESILRQSVAPERLVLVLSKEEFPDKKVPRSISRLTGRGLEILWVDHNGRSFDKLLPVIEAFPGEAIITTDDDKIFPPTLLESLYREYVRSPDSVVGARGWSIRPAGRDDEVHYGQDWVRAVAGEKGMHLLMPGGNGCLYPPASLDETVLDMELALRLCPTADDIWFWASIQRTKTNSVCLGLAPHRPVSQQKETSALSDVNGEQNDHQFQAVINHFDLTVQLLKA